MGNLQVPGVVQETVGILKAGTPDFSGACRDGEEGCRGQSWRVGSSAGLLLPESDAV